MQIFSWIQTLLTFVLYVRQTRLTQLILAIFSEGLSSFNTKVFCYSYAWSCSLCEGGTSFCMGCISSKFCGLLYFWLALLHSVFFLYWSPLSLCKVFHSISSNIDEVLSENHLLMCLFLDILTSMKSTG